MFAGLNVLLAGLLADDLQSFQMEYVMAFLIVFLTGVTSFAFNDYHDYEVDRRNDRYDRPLISGLLPRSTALITVFISLALILFLSIRLNSEARALVLLSLPHFILYSLGLKRILPLKNVVIAYAFVWQRSSSDRSFPTLFLSRSSCISP